jgi:hypothetical protein
MTDDQPDRAFQAWRLRGELDPGRSCARLPREGGARFGAQLQDSGDDIVGFIQNQVAALVAVRLPVCMSLAAADSSSPISDVTRPRMIGSD